MMRRIPILIFIFHFTILSPIILHSQPKMRDAFFPKEKFDLAVSAFGGYIRHFNDRYGTQFDKSASPSYGGSIIFQASNVLGLQFDVKHLQEDDSYQSTSERSDGLYNCDNYVDELDHTSFTLSLLVFPAEVINKIGLKPYFRVGWSVNLINAHIEWTRIVKDENDEIIETENLTLVDTSNDGKRYQNGFVLASGLYLMPDSFINLFIEMQYHAIHSRAYDGGVFFNGGVIFTIF